MSFQLPMPQPSTGGEFPFTQLSGPSGGGRNYIIYTLRHINWLAHVLHTSKFAPPTLEYREFLDTLHQYLTGLMFYASAPVSAIARKSLIDLEKHEHDYAELSQRLSKHFSALPWRALLIPGGISDTSLLLGTVVGGRHIYDIHEMYQKEIIANNLNRVLSEELIKDEELKQLQKEEFARLDQIIEHKLDLRYRAQYAQRVLHRSMNNLLVSKEIVKDIADILPVYPGIVMQLGAPVDQIFYLESAFFALQVAFANANKWPGILIWNTKRESAFFPLSLNDDHARQAIHWVFSEIAQQPDISVESLKTRYANIVAPSATTSATKPLTIIQTSDMHLGNKVSDSRLLTVKDRILELNRDYQSDSVVVPVVTGDLMDTPGKRHLDSLYDYLHFLDRLGSERPVVILGNHDVRKWGVLSKSYEEALRLYIRPIVWLDDSKVGLICFNSVRGGNLAQGMIDEQEFATLGHELDVDSDRSRNYMLLALLHHHPCPVERPGWYAKVWYERWLGNWFDKTVELKNASIFLEWLTKRNVSMALHGHKHIPRVTQLGGVSIIGCGSTVGKVPSEVEGKTFMSINIVSIDLDSGRISCRLRAEQIVGAGLSDVEVHEILYRETVTLAA